MTTREAEWAMTLIHAKDVIVAATILVENEDGPTLHDLVELQDALKVLRGEA